MIERINEKEKELNKLLKIVHKLQNDVDTFDKLKDSLVDINNYYGSSDYFYDLEEYEKGNIKVPCGILAEDTIWNMQDDIIEIAGKMNEIAAIISEE